MRFIYGVLGLLFLFGPVHANPAAEEQKVPASDEDAIAMARVACAEVMTGYANPEKLTWTVSRDKIGHWFVSAREEENFGKLGYSHVTFMMG